MSNAQNNLMMEWNTINWRQVEIKVFKLQKRIYQASLRGDIKSVRKLQKTLLKSWSGKLLAVRKVCQDNQGKKTPGVDGVKSLSPKQRVKLCKNLKITNKVSPVRKIGIPKEHSKNDIRYLGIPTIKDRALQCLVKFALEAEWEAKFEDNSYGFRPGKSCHDAIESVFNNIRFKSKYVLLSDISKCFDRINHRSLLMKINTFPKLKKLIKDWLKAGLVHNKVYSPTEKGTPQGGVISPLLANIALHGMENLLKNYAASWKGGKIRNQESLSLIRYADDFVIIHESKEVIEKCRHLIENFLSGIGLELSSKKTKIIHTLEEVNGQEGFDFLGFHVREYKVGKYRSAKNTKREILGFNTLTKPSSRSIKEHLEKIKKICRIHRNCTQETLILKLNSVIRGWCNYFKSGVSTEAFRKCDFALYNILRAWSRRIHKGKNCWDKYWRRDEKGCMRFMTANGTRLISHLEYEIVRHIKVKKNSSVFDGDWSYWATRKGNYLLLKM